MRSAVVIPGRPNVSFRNWDGVEIMKSKLFMEVLMRRNHKHGEASREKKSREYRAWCGAKRRCYTKTHPKYSSYGGRGIKMCDRWFDSYENFLVDMGRCPKGMTLGRKDNDGDYSPENCRWETQKQQANNRRSSVWVEFNGCRMTLSQWAEFSGMKEGTIRYRIKNGYPLEKALSSTLFTDVGRFKMGWNSA